MQFRLAPEVARALDRGDPVVALESSLVAHGFPRPDNLSVGRALEREVREAGAAPATIAVLDGEVRVGLAADEIERLATSDQVTKCSLRDLPWLCARGGSGATTVAATLRIAAQAGIGVFATGGIGGVHRRHGGPPDVSADLYALASTPLTVVSAGAKSILDLPATLECLETLGVPVIGYRCDEFPAFHTAASGLELRHRVDEVDELAAVARAKAELGLGCALLVCNPPPPESALAGDEVERLVAAALAEVEAEGIAGPELTPYLLAALDRLSGGRTRAVNRALVEANARLGAQLAVALAKGAV
jgi:pseudouridine-5'-phosphate glycosidase